MGLLALTFFSSPTDFFRYAASTLLNFILPHSILFSSPTPTLSGARDKDNARHPQGGIRELTLKFPTSFLFVADSFSLRLTLAPHNTKSFLVFGVNKLQRETKKKKNEQHFVKMHKTCGKYFNEFSKEKLAISSISWSFPLCSSQGLLFVRNGIIELSDRWLFMMLHAICLNVVHNKTNWGFSLLDTNVK